MNQSKISTPNSLYHYTSVDVLCKLFSGIKKDCLIFHASSVDFMNDSEEYAISRSLCKDEVDNILADTKMGLPFALCFTDSENNIPMWSMYGDEGKGVCLKFNFSKLDVFLRKQKSEDRIIIFSKCVYQKISQIEDKPLCANTDYPNLAKLCEEMRIAAFVKPDFFVHENEWRLMAWNSWKFPEIQNVLFKKVRNEICPYIEISIPVDCLEGILLGPSASNQMIEAVKLMRFKYTHGKNILIDKVKISLKV